MDLCQTYTLLCINPPLTTHRIAIVLEDVTRLARRRKSCQPTVLIREHGCTARTTCAVVGQPLQRMLGGQRQWTDPMD